MAIGNMVGKFRYMDPCILGAKDKMVAWIQVEVYFSSRLLGSIDMEWDSCHFCQRLDYWGIPF